MKAGVGYAIGSIAGGSGGVPHVIARGVINEAIFVEVRRSGGEVQDTFSSV